MGRYSTGRPAHCQPPSKSGGETPRHFEGIAIFQQLTDTRPTQPLQMEKCASHLVSAPLVLLLLQPHPLPTDNRGCQHAHHGESLASVKDDDVLGICTSRIEERPGTIWIDLVASARPLDIGPVYNFTVLASGLANDAARPFTVKEVDANLSDRATQLIVHARKVEGILPFEAGNATAVILGMNVDDGPWNAGKSRKEHETCCEKKILS